MKSIVIKLKDIKDFDITYKNIISSTILHDKNVFNISIEINKTTWSHYNIPIDQVICIEEHSETII